jgi:hypothetical protein
MKAITDATHAPEIQKLEFAMKKNGRHSKKSNPEIARPATNIVLKTSESFSAISFPVDNRAGAACGHSNVLIELRDFAFEVLRN